LAGFWLTDEAAISPHILSTGACVGARIAPIRSKLLPVISSVTYLRKLACRFAGNPARCHEVETELSRKNFLFGHVEKFLRR